jgi:hypothetical protein
MMRIAKYTRQLKRRKRIKEALARGVANFGSLRAAKRRRKWFKKHRRLFLTESTGS